MDTTGWQLETFISENEVDEVTGNWLRMLSSDMVRYVLDGPTPRKGIGFLPTIIARVRKAAQEGADPSVDITSFMTQSGMNENAMDALLLQGDDVQQAIVRMGPLSGANASGELMSRMRKATQPAGQAHPDWGASKEAGGFPRLGGRMQQQKHTPLAPAWGAWGGGNGAGTIPSPPPFAPPMAVTPPFTDLHQLTSAVQQFDLSARQLATSEGDLRACFDRVLSARRAAAGFEQQPKAKKRRADPAAGPKPTARARRDKTAAEAAIANLSPAEEAAKKEALLVGIKELIGEAGGALNIERIGEQPAIKELRRGLPQSLTNMIREFPEDLQLVEGTPRADGNKLITVQLVPS